MIRQFRVALAALVVAGTTQAAFLPVCDRTPAVKEFLVLTAKKTCETITAADLATIKRVTVAGKNISQFKVDDFSGLTGLEILNIRSNPFTELPEGFFKDLGSLKTLVIIGGALRHYPDDFLEHTPLIENLHTFRIGVRSLSESVLSRMEGLKHLKVLDFDDDILPLEKARLRRRFPENGPVELSFI